MKHIRKILNFFLVLFVISLLLHFTVWGKRVESMLREGLIRVAYLGYGTRTALIPKPSVERVNATSTNAYEQQLEKENESLRALLGFKQKEGQKTVGAEVTGRSLDPSRRAVVINLGQDDGIAEGSPVIAGDSVLVGVVSEVSEHSSIVRLLTDPQSRVAGRLLNDTQTEGVISGGHGIVVRMELVPRGEVVVNDTFLVTSGLDSLIPRGLTIGKVRNTEADVNSLFQRIIIEPPLDYSTLQFVVVGVNK